MDSTDLSTQYVPRGRNTDTPSSRAADQDSRNENQDSAQSDLQRCRQGRRLHVTMPDPGDDAQLDHNHQPRGSNRGAEIRDQEWERVADPAKSRHETANESPHPRMTAPGETAVIGQSFGKAHAD